MCEKCYKPIAVQRYIDNCISQLPRLTLLAYKQIELMNMLSEWNAFVCREFAVEIVYTVNSVNTVTTPVPDSSSLSSICCC